jgi:hypothetical protein
MGVFEWRVGRVRTPPAPLTTSWFAETRGAASSSEKKTRGTSSIGGICCFRRCSGAALHGRSCQTTASSLCRALAGGVAVARRSGRGHLLREPAPSSRESEGRCRPLGDPGARSPGSVGCCDARDLSFRGEPRTAPRQGSSPRGAPSRRRRSRPSGKLNVQHRPPGGHYRRLSFAGADGSRPGAKRPGLGHALAPRSDGSSAPPAPRGSSSPAFSHQPHRPGATKASPGCVPRSRKNGSPPDR